MKNLWVLRIYWRKTYEKNFYCMRQYRVSIGLYDNIYPSIGCKIQNKYLITEARLPV